MMRIVFGAHIRFSRMIQGKFYIGIHNANLFEKEIQKAGPGSIGTASGTTA